MAYAGSWPDKAEVAALRFMVEKPLRINPFSVPPNVEKVAAMLDRLAGMDLCHRTLVGLSRGYSITPKGAEVIYKGNVQA